MDAEKFVEKLYAAGLQQKAGEFQIDYGYRSSFGLRALDGKIDKRSFTENQGITFSVKKGKNIGSFDCGELEERNIPLIIEQAEANALLISGDEENFFHDGSGSYQKVKKSAPVSALYAKLDKEKYVLELEKAAYAYDKRIKKVISTFLGEGESKRFMKNSHGLDLSEKENSAYAYLYLSAESGGVTRTGSEIVFFDKEEDFNPAGVAAKAAQKALDKLNPTNIKSGNRKIVFENKAFADFLETTAGIFSANSVQEKRSKLVGKLGQKIASGFVNLVDNPLLDGGYNSRSFDGEGYPCRLNEVIKDGILNTYLYNLRTAHKDGVSSTGNGSGSGNRGISFSNFYVMPGMLSRDEVLAQAGDGVYIVGLNGMHAGYSSVSGDFSFGAEAFEIKGGKLGRALNQITVSGNVYRLWNEIEAIGGDLAFNPSAFGAPTVFVRELSISNE